MNDPTLRTGRDILTHVSSQRPHRDFLYTAGSHPWLAFTGIIDYPLATSIVDPCLYFVTRCLLVHLLPLWKLSCARRSGKTLDILPLSSSRDSLVSLNVSTLLDISLVFCINSLKPFSSYLANIIVTPLFVPLSIATMHTRPPSKMHNV